MQADFNTLRKGLEEKKREGKKRKGNKHISFTKRPATERDK